MPSTSKKQHNFMAAIANNPAFAKKVGVPQSVGKDFTAADKGRTFSKGGDMKKMAQGGDTIHHHLAAHHMREAAKHMKMAGGGETMGPSNMGSDVEKGSNTKKSYGEHGIQKSGRTRAMEPKMSGSDTGMKRGGRTK